MSNVLRRRKKKKKAALTLLLGGGSMEKAMAPTPVLLPGKSHGWRCADLGLCWAARLKPKRLKDYL